MQVVVNSLLTHYEQAGHGKRTVLLLHGWGDNLHTFKELQKFLSSGYNVISLDLPGFGSSQAPQEVWDLDMYADFVSSFLHKIDRTTYAVIAHSNGAALAIRALATKKISSQKLVVLGASGIRNRQKGRRFVIKVIAKSGKVATFWLPKTQKQKLRKFLYGAAGSDMLVAPHLQETFKKTVRQDVQQDAAKLQLPVLLIYGEDDKATPPLYGQIYHELISNSTLEIISRASHFVHQDKPQLVHDMIGDFLA